MKTLIRGAWVVRWNGSKHELLRDGVVVVEDDRVIFVGDEYEFPVDRSIDMPGALISPGLISTHRHAGVNALSHIYLDRGRPNAFGRNYLNWQAVTEGSRRYKPDVRTSVLFGLGQCLKSGITTVLEFGAAAAPDEFVEAVDQLGIRCFSGPSYRAVTMYSSDDGELQYSWEDGADAAGLKRAIEFVQKYSGAASNRFTPILTPGHVDSCSEEVLRDTSAISRELNIPVSIHTSINPEEVDRVERRYGVTPIQLLERTELLSPQVILGHVVFPGEHSWVNRAVNDIETLGRHGATVSYSALKFLHMGAYMESVQRYIDAGVNMTIGTDFTPADIVAEMRYAMLSSRVADRSFLSCTPRDVFDAATVNAAQALGRPDLGRLHAGAKADLVAFDLRSMVFGFVHDPIRSLVESGHGSDAKLVMVDGQILVEDGKLTMIDEDQLLADVELEGARVIADTPNWLWGGGPPMRQYPCHTTWFNRGCQSVISRPVRQP